MTDIFLSYKREDQGTAKTLAEALELGQKLRDGHFRWHQHLLVGLTLVRLSRSEAPSLSRPQALSQEDSPLSP